LLKLIPLLLSSLPCLPQTQLPINFLLGCSLVGQAGSADRLATGGFGLGPDGVGPGNSGLFVRKTINEIWHGWVDPIAGLAPGSPAFYGVGGQPRMETIQDYRDQIAAGTMRARTSVQQTGKDNWQDVDKYIHWRGHGIIYANQSAATDYPKYPGYSTNGSVNGLPFDLRNYQPIENQKPTAKDDFPDAWSTMFTASPGHALDNPITRGDDVEVFLSSPLQNFPVACEAPCEFTKVYARHHTLNGKEPDQRKFAWAKKYSAPTYGRTLKKNGVPSNTCAGTSSAQFVRTTLATGGTAAQAGTASTCDWGLRYSWVIDNSENRGAPLAVTLPYMGLANETIRDSVSIVNSSGAEQYFDHDQHMAQLWLEPLSGFAVKADERLQNNFYIEKKMFDSSAYANIFTATTDNDDVFIWPYVWYDRAVGMEQDSADNIAKIYKGYGLLSFICWIALWLAVLLICLLLVEYFYPLNKLQNMDDESFLAKNLPKTNMVSPGSAAYLKELDAEKEKSACPTSSTTSASTPADTLQDVETAVNDAQSMEEEKAALEAAVHRGLIKRPSVSSVFAEINESKSTRLMGLRPSWENENTPRHLTPDLPKMYLLVECLKGYPMHWLVETAQVLPAFAIALVPVLFFQAFVNSLVDDLDPTGTFKQNDLYKAGDMSSSTKNWAMIWALVRITLTPWLPVTMVFTTLWNWREMARCGVIQTFVIGWSISAMSACLGRALTFDGVTFLHENEFYLNAFFSMLCLFYASYRAGHMVGAPYFGVVLIPFFLFIYIIAVAYERILWKNILTSSDWWKIFFVCALNPAVMEVLMLYGRFLARVARKNHPSTSSWLVAVAMIFKKIFGRFVIATISDSGIVTFSSFLLGITEIVIACTVKERDRWMYTVSFTGYVADPLNAMKSARNAQFRVDVATMETMIEVIMIWICSILVLSVNISNDQSNPPVTGDVIFNGVLQHGFEVVVDLTIIIVLNVFQGEDYYVKATRGRFKYKWFTLGIACAFASSFIVGRNIPNVVVRQAGAHNATWIYCTDSDALAGMGYTVSCYD